MSGLYTCLNFLLIILWFQQNTDIEQYGLGIGCISVTISMYLASYCSKKNNISILYIFYN
jgi:hypothetical protein